MQAKKTMHGLDGQHQDMDRTLRVRVNQNDRTETNGESTSMVLPTIGSMTAKEQNTTDSLADGNQCIRIREKTMEFSSTALSTLSPYFTGLQVISVIIYTFNRAMKTDFCPVSDSAAHTEKNCQKPPICEKAASKVTVISCICMPV